MQALFRTISVIVFIVVCININAQDIESLRRENARLQSTVDSLRIELARSRTSLSALSSFSGLSGFDSEDVNITEGWGSLESADAEHVTIDSLNRLLNIPIDEYVDKYIVIYSLTKRENMSGILQRFDRYKGYIYTVFDQYNIPRQFAELCIVESAVNPNANSKSGAAGMWQLLEDTAREYGLTVNLVSDERYDVNKSTVAAAGYLAFAYKTFGNWTLALMSYNCGIGALQNAIAKSKNKKSYLDIIQYLPQETREYIPALLAAMYINNNRNKLTENFPLS